MSTATLTHSSHFLATVRDLFAGWFAARTATPARPLTRCEEAEQLRAMNAAPAILLPLLATMSAWLDFLIASGSAKWAAMSPVATPMMMLVPHPRWHASSAIRITSVLPVASNV